MDENEKVHQEHLEENKRTREENKDMLKDFMSSLPKIVSRVIVEVATMLI